MYSGLFHPYNKIHGPFDFYKCNNCGSGITLEPPDELKIKELYKSFDRGMIPSVRNLRDKYPLSKWFLQCINRAIKGAEKEYQKNSEFVWIDIGAGSGELATLMSEKFPLAKGWAIDFHEQPDFIKAFPNLNWVTINLNNEAFNDSIPESAADLVFSITVLEHVLHPGIFLKNALELLKKGGRLYITVPDFGSIPSKIMGSKWPYFIPGEHLYIPSRKGMEILLDRICGQTFKKDQFKIEVKKTILPYPINYFLDYFNMGILTKILPKKWAPNIPTGMMEALISISPTDNVT
ncbi:MAG: hypothetical protein C5B52_07665 [Bacteroidetes bacterium]|nr:MAG: hypothetical protein C5B52_07665 [Bacteroidota bacterium]